LTSGRKLEVALRLDPEDDLQGSGQQEMAIQLLTDSATIELDADPGRIHPDLLALALLAFLAPWAKRRLLLDQGVSAGFADTVSEHVGIEIGPVDDSLPQRRPGSKHGLMYSGGPDCMAAQVLLDTPMTLFHFRRVRHPRVPNRATRFQAGVQEAVVRRTESRGEELHVARSDLEYLCLPFPTFPHWVALTVGAVLLAETLDLGRIATGRNISGIYLGWGKRFTPDGEQESRWEALYSAAGLSLIHPLAGATDIVSKRISTTYPHHDLARSCVAGTLEAPCHRCKKCLLTELIKAAIAGAPLPEHVVASLSSNKSLTRLANRPPPYADQHLLAYTLARVPGAESTFLAPLKAKLAASADSTGWMDRYYRPALIDRLPSDVADQVAQRLEGHVDFMTPEEEKIVENWSAAG
jgi:hypothetical protein